MVKLNKKAVIYLTFRHKETAEEWLKVHGINYDFAFLPELRKIIYVDVNFEVANFVDDIKLRKVEED